MQMGEMSPEDAAQLLKDFDEQNGERKPWKPIRGQARPAKDWTGKASAAEKCLHFSMAEPPSLARSATTGKAGF